MPRIQIYLPDDLYRAVKVGDLPISELSQNAVRAALHRDELRAETEGYLDELATQLGGPPTKKELAAADRWIEGKMTLARRRAS